MFSKAAILMTATMAALVVAGDINDSCNSGPVQCCRWPLTCSPFSRILIIWTLGNQTFESGSEASNFLHGIVNAVVNPVSAQAGLICNPISVIGVGSGAQCSSQPVCCTGNHMGELYLNPSVSSIILIIPLCRWSRRCWMLSSQPQRLDFVFARQLENFLIGLFCLDCGFCLSLQPHNSISRVLCFLLTWASFLSLLECYGFAIKRPRFSIFKCLILTIWSILEVIEELQIFVLM